MKKTTMVILMLASCAAFSFADQGEQSAAPQEAPKEAVQEAVQEAAQEAPKEAAKEVTLRTGATDSITGKVDSVMFADPLARPRSRIVIIDALGKSCELVVKAVAVVYDSTGRLLTLDDILPGQEVKVNYIPKSRTVKEATAIKVLK
jgi:glucose/arabinose dehydrogenase